MAAVILDSAVAVGIVMNVRCVADAATATFVIIQSGQVIVVNVITAQKHIIVLHASIVQIVTIVRTLLVIKVRLIKNIGLTRNITMINKLL